jgi:hypothetical protein
MLVREHGGDPMVPHIATVKALQQREPKAAPETRQSEPRLISTEVGVSRDSTGKVCTDDRNALAFGAFALVTPCPKALTGTSSAEFLGGTNHPDSA